MKKSIVLFSLLIALSMFPAAAQEQPARAAVYVQTSADDSVGRDLAYQIRETIRRSSSLMLTDRGVDARFILRIVTLDPDSNTSPGSSTVYSAVYTMHTFHEDPVEMYLTSVVGTCGRNRIDSCARSITATVDEEAINLRRMLRNMLDSSGNRN